jgi:hypothetical protein
MRPLNVEIRTELKAKDCIQCIVLRNLQKDESRLGWSNFSRRTYQLLATLAFNSAAVATVAAGRNQTSLTE